MGDNKQLSEISWKIAGFAGQGIKGSGEMFSKLMAGLGFDIFDYTEYPSLIKGGHNTYEVHAAAGTVLCRKKQIDILVCLNKNGLLFHLEELHQGSVVMCDLKDEKIDISKMSLPCKVIDVPWFAAVSDLGADRMMANNASLGASVALLGIEFERLKSLIAQEFAHKSEKVVELNTQVAKYGFDFIQKAQLSFGVLVPAKQPRKTISGNEAIGLGALAGGLEFYAAYPMSPSTGVLHYLAEKGPEMGVMVKHSEDEIGVVNMALGASYAGARSMVGTSGGGFCYMVEALGMAGVAELPLVVMLAQRPGPALGMPTWSSQADLLFAIFSSHDEFPKIVLAPGDAQEAFEYAGLALRLAEKYQTLVILLTDKNLCEGRSTISLSQTVFEHQRQGLLTDPKPDETGFFARYYPTSSGVSYRSIPGVKGGNHLTNSYEHDQYGLANEESETRVVQMDKRMRKMEMVKNEITKQTIVAEFGAQVGLIGFGSNKGVLLKARELLALQGVRANVLCLNWLWPFPDRVVEDFAQMAQTQIVVENNATGQLATLIASRMGWKTPHRLNRYDGRPFYAEEIELFVKKLVNNG